MAKAKTDDTTTRLRKLSLPELQILADAAEFAANAWSAIANQPRASGLAVAAGFLTDETERCDRILDLVGQRISRAKVSYAD
jgi:hypothetical protein